MGKMKTNKRYIATVTEDSYMKYTYTTMLSLLKLTSIDMIYIVTMESISDRNKFIFNHMTSQYGCSTEYLVVDELPDEFSDTIWKKSIWLKLMLLDILPDSVDRLLYLDSDITVIKDISNLFELDMKDKCIAGCIDYNLSRNYREYLDSLEIGYDRYVNAGVLLLDLTNIKKQDKSLNDCLSFISGHSDLKFADQDVWNSVFKDCFYYLDSKVYNFATAQFDKNELNIQEVEKNLAIIHYAGCKPWIYVESGVLSKWFWPIAKESPYYDDILTDYERSKEQFLSKGISILEQRDKMTRYYKLCSAWVDILISRQDISSYFEEKGMQKIALYGIGDFGKKLINELKATNIDVVCAYDEFSKIDNYNDVPIVNDREKFSDRYFKIDGIVITPILEFNSLAELVRKDFKCEIISVEKMISDLK